LDSESLVEIVRVVLGWVIRSCRVLDGGVRQCQRNVAVHGECVAYSSRSELPGRLIPGQVTTAW